PTASDQSASPLSMVAATSSSLGKYRSASSRRSARGIAQPRMMLLYDRGETRPRLARVVPHRAVRSPERARDLVERQTAEVVHTEDARADRLLLRQTVERGFQLGARGRVVERGEDRIVLHDRELVDRLHRHAAAARRCDPSVRVATSIATLLAEHLPRHEMRPVGEPTFRI